MGISLSTLKVDNLSRQIIVKKQNKQKTQQINSHSSVKGVYRLNKEEKTLNHNFLFSNITCKQVNK